MLTLFLIFVLSPTLALADAEFDALETKAKTGDAKAQYSLGRSYYYGYGVERNCAKAFEFYEKAAVAGYTEAQFALGNCYYFNDGVPKNYAKAVEWHRKAAAQGHASAQSNLGSCYFDAEGVTKDYVKAYAWCNLAAAQEKTFASRKLLALEKEMTREQVAEAQKLSVTYAELIKQGKPLPAQ